MSERAATSVVDLGQDECETLLAEAVVGRLGVVVDGRPEIFPVCHVFVDGSVAFPTNEGTKLSAAESWPSVVFEIDGVESSGFAGWSVVVKGHLERIEHEAETTALARQRVALWRTGPSARWVRLVASETTGRRLEALPRPQA